MSEVANGIDRMWQRLVQMANDQFDSGSAALIVEGSVRKIEDCHLPFSIFDPQNCDKSF